MRLDGDDDVVFVVVVFLRVQENAECFVDLSDAGWIPTECANEPACGRPGRSRLRDG